MTNSQTHPPAGTLTGTAHDRWQERVVGLRERMRTVDTADAERVPACVDEWSRLLENLGVFGSA